MTNKLNNISLILRKNILDCIYESGKGHIGGAYSCIDILTTLYFGEFANMNWDDPKRDRFIMSKGHAAIAQYAILNYVGLISEKEFMNMNNGGILGEHPDVNIPGIEFNTGSLGHGLGVGVGFALADRTRFNYVLLGDGECYEGSIWEAANLASHLKLHNLVAIVDRNNLCIHGNTEDVNQLEPFADKWKAFGWNVVQVDGHNHEDLLDTLSMPPAPNFLEVDEIMPTVIIADTIKGKGVSFMENNHKWHHGGIDKETYDKAMEELNG